MNSEACPYINARYQLWTDEILPLHYEECAWSVTQHTFGLLYVHRKAKWGTLFLTYLNRPFHKTMFALCFDLGQQISRPIHRDFFGTVFNPPIGQVSDFLMIFTHSMNYNWLISVQNKPGEVACWFAPYPTSILVVSDFNTCQSLL